MINRKNVSRKDTLLKENSPGTNRELNLKEYSLNQDGANANKDEGEPIIENDSPDIRDEDSKDADNASIKDNG